MNRDARPQTPGGNARSRMNARKHGERSAEAVEARAMDAACLRVLREDARALTELMRQATESLD